MNRTTTSVVAVTSRSSGRSRVYTFTSLKSRNSESFNPQKTHLYRDKGKMTALLLGYYCIMTFGVIILLMFVIVPFVLATITIVRQPLVRFPRERGDSALYTGTDTGARSNNQKQNHHRDKRRRATRQAPFVSKSGMYTGRVWHTRFLPVHHAFTYPLFIFGVHLDELYYEKIEDDASVDDTTDVSNEITSGQQSQQKLAFNDHLWPLSLLVSFRIRDHLKNGEGLVITKPMEASLATTTSNESSTTKITSIQQQHVLLSDRIYTLVHERTKGSFQPNQTTHYIFLVTQLSYYGYCFNPVSFYYIYERNCNRSSSRSNDSSIGNSQHQHQHQPKPDRLVAVVGEVSNTPWNEMYCYVLHEKSIDMADEYRRKDSISNSTANTGSIQYIFPKRFHVSPFMEMSFNYEWTFRSFSVEDDDDARSTREHETYENNIKNRSTSIHVINNLRPLQQRYKEMTKQKLVDPNHTFDNKIKSENDIHNSTRAGLQFNATMHVHRYRIHPYRIAYYMMTYPIYCMIIQLWIHIQALVLFTKGVSYQPDPHNDNNETGISRIIGTIMIPFFYIRDHYYSNTTSTPVLEATTAATIKSKLS